MKGVSTGFEHLIELQHQIFSLFCDEISNNSSHKFSCDFFDKYRQKKNEFYQNSVSHLTDTHKDFRGERLYNIDDIKIELTDDCHFSPSIKFAPHKAHISIPIRYCFVLDIFNFCFNAKRTNYENTGFECDLYTQIIFEAFDDYLFSFIKQALGRILNYPVWQVKLTVFTSALSSLSVLYHEIAHFASGHTTYYYDSDGSASIAKDDLALFYSEEEDKCNIQDATELWIAELTADTYAFIRLFLYTDNYSELVTICKGVPFIFHRFIPVVEASITPIFLMSLKRQTKTPLPEQYSTHPHFEVRELNIYSTLYFCMSPLQQQWYDVRKTQLDSTFYAKRALEAEDSIQYKKNRIQVDHAFATAVYESICNFGRHGLSLEGKNLAFIGTALYTAKAGQYGIFQPFDSSSQRFIDNNVELWGYLWVEMSSGQNLQFSRGMHENWSRIYPDLKSAELYNLDHLDEDSQQMILMYIKGLSLIRDPVFKIIDDWMSCVFRYTKKDVEADQKTRLQLIEFIAQEVDLAGRQLDLF